MEEVEDFKSLRSRFQKSIETNQVKRPPPRPGLKPILPIKPNTGTVPPQCFEKPVPKALSSPELPVAPSREIVKTPGHVSNLQHSFSFHNNSKTKLDTHDANAKDTKPPQVLIQTEKNRMVCQPSVKNNATNQIVKPALPKRPENIVIKPNFVPVSPKPRPVPCKPTEQKGVYIPKLKLLPSIAILGPKPNKPARPPFVDLDSFKKSDDFDDYVVMRSYTELPRCSESQSPKLTSSPRLTASQSQPNLMTCFSTRHIRSRQSIGESRGLYEDVLRFCPIQKEKSASLQSFVIPETPPRPDSVEEVYDDVETIAEKSKPPPPEPRNLIEENILITNWRNETNLKKMERLEREFRKNFQYNGQVKVLTRMMVDPNAIVRKPGEKDLAYTRGEIMDVIELTSVEKVLCRNYGGKFGYMPRTALLRIEKNVYDSVLAAEEVYDDTELISTTFPAVPPKQRFQNGYVTRMFQRNQSQLSKGSSKAEITKKEISKNNKKEEKELKELKKKFKFEGEVKVLTRMMVVPSAGNRRGGFKDLSISKGEIFEVIQYTNQEKLLCRNTKGKYGYVKRKYVLQLENDLYDDAETLSSGAINRRI